MTKVSYKPKKKIKSKGFLSKTDLESSPQWNYCAKIIKTNSFLISVGIIGSSLILIILTIPVRYEVHDDFFMITILRGTGGFSPCKDAIFINPVLSYLLYFLYKCSASIPWYGIFLYLLHFCGWSLISSMILRSNRGLCFIFTLPLLLVSFFYHSSYITFTSVTILLMFGVFLCIMEYFIADYIIFKNNRCYIILLAVCYYLAFLLRWYLMIYSLIFILPIVFFIKRQKIKPVIMPIATLVILISLNLGFIYYTISRNDDFYDFNKLRAEFHDTDKGGYHHQITHNALNKVGWSNEDYLIFKKLWFMYDNNTFNTQTLEVFLNQNNPTKSHKLIISKIVERYKENKNEVVLLIISLASIFLYRSRYLISPRRNEIIKIVFTLGLLVCTIIFFMYYRFVIRIFQPLYVYLLCMAFLLLNTIDTSLNLNLRNNKLTSFAKITVLSISLMYSTILVNHAFRVFTFDLNESKKYNHYTKEIVDYIEKDNLTKPPIILDMCFSFRLEYAHPLKEYNGYPNLKLIPHGWATNSKYYDLALGSIGLRNGYDLLKSLVDRHDILLSMKVNNIEQMNLILNLWKSYYIRHVYPNKKIDFEPVYDFRNQAGVGLIFYQIISST